MKLQKRSPRPFLTGLGEGGGGLNIFLTNQSDNSLNLAFGEIIMAPWAR